MIINKLVNSKIEREYFFVKGKLNIDVKYFMDQIDQGCMADDNKNYQTNVVGQMTSYDYFLGNRRFAKVLMPILDLIDSYKFKEIDSYTLGEAWGIRECFSDYTVKHHHLPAFLSGAIMLNKHSQLLEFDDIGEKLECEPGNFALFSSFLNHGNKRNVDDKCRYGLSFNFFYKK